MGMNLKSTPFLVLFVILGSIALTTAFAGELVHDIELDGKVWVTDFLMIDGDVTVIEDLDVGGEIRQGGVSIEIIFTQPFTGSADPNDVDPGGNVGDIYIQDNGIIWIQVSLGAWGVISSPDEKLLITGMGPPTEDPGVADAAYIDTKTSQIYEWVDGIDIWLGPFPVNLEQLEVTGALTVGGNPVPVIREGPDDPNAADIDGKKGDIYVQDNGRFAINIDPFDEDSWSFGNTGDGATVFVDFRDPEATEGEVGDHWLNTATGDVFIKTDETTWTLVNNDVFFTSRDPEASEGQEGDHFINIETGQVFVKFDDGWHSLGPLIVTQSSNPLDSEGEVGDLWKNSITDQFFVKFSDGWLNVGSEIFVEPTDPEASDGEVGDHWLNTDTGDVFIKTDETTWTPIGGPPGEISVTLVEDGCVAPVNDFCQVTVECPLGRVAIGPVAIPSDSVTGDPSPPFSVFGGCDIRHDPLTDIESAFCEGDAFEQPNPVDWHFRLPCVTAP